MAKVEEITEQSVDRRIEHFMKLFGILEEGEIVADDDYESTVSVAYDELEKG